MKATLFILILFSSCTIYPHEMRKEIIAPTYDDWEAGYSETSSEIIMSQLDDWDEPEYIHGGHSTFQINKIDRDYIIGQADGTIDWSTVDTIDYSPPDPIIRMSDLIQYETECYNDSSQVWDYSQDAHQLSYQLPRLVWAHTEPTFSGFIQWLKNRK